LLGQRRAAAQTQNQRRYDAAAEQNNRLTIHTGSLWERVLNPVHTGLTSSLIESPPWQGYSPQ
jgi:hypothetical protein